MGNESAARLRRNRLRALLTSASAYSRHRTGTRVVRWPSPPRRWRGGAVRGPGRPVSRIDEALMRDRLREVHQKAAGEVLISSPTLVVTPRIEELRAASFEERRAAYLQGRTEDQPDGPCPKADGGHPHAAPDAPATAASPPAGSPTSANTRTAPASRNTLTCESTSPAGRVVRAYRHHTSDSFARNRTYRVVTFSSWSPASTGCPSRGPPRPPSSECGGQPPARARRKSANGFATSGPPSPSRKRNCPWGLTSSQ